MKETIYEAIYISGVTKVKQKVKIVVEWCDSFGWCRCLSSNDVVYDKEELKIL